MPLSGWQADGKLAHLSIAVSRGERPQYVQDALRQQAPRITAAISQGARIMVCGGRDMARGVADVAGSHLLDDSTASDNVAFVRRLFPNRQMVLLTLAAGGLVALSLSLGQRRAASRGRG